MPLLPLPPRRLILHVGTHKTGTKALQIYLEANRIPLADTGVHYPRAGRHLFDGRITTPGHHQIAFDFQNERGSASFAAVVDEIRNVQAATVILSSEEFLPLAHLPGILETIVATSRELGYEPVAVVVFRAQPAYLESMYSELAKASSASSLDDLVDQAVVQGQFTPVGYRYPFDLTYTATVRRLEAIFGVGNVMARAYRPDRGLEFGSLDFLSVVARARGGMQLRNARNPQPSANERVTLAQLFSNIVQTVAGKIDAASLAQEVLPHLDEADLARPFCLMTRADCLRLLSRFGADNAAINARFGIEIPFVSESDIKISDEDDRRARQQRAMLAALLEAIERSSRTQRRVQTMRDDSLEKSVTRSKG